MAVEKTHTVRQARILTPENSAVTAEFLPDDAYHRYGMLRGVWPDPDVEVTVWRDDATGPEPEDEGALHVVVTPGEPHGSNIVLHLGDDIVFRGHYYDDEARTPAEALRIIAQYLELYPAGIRADLIRDAMKGVTL